MSKGMWWCVIMGLWMSGIPLRAQGTAAPAGPRFGFVDSMEVLYETEEGKTAIDQLNSYMAQKQQEIQQKTEDLQRLQEQYTSQQRTLNRETRAEMEQAIADQQKNLTRLREDVQAEINRRQNNLLSSLGEKIQRVVDEFAAQNRYDVIFLRDDSQAYVDPALDVTQQIIQLYNSKYAPGASSPAAPAAPPPNP